GIPGPPARTSGALDGRWSNAAAADGASRSAVIPVVVGPARDGFDLAAVHGLGLDGDGALAVARALMISVLGLGDDVRDTPPDGDVAPIRDVLSRDTASSGARPGA